MNIYKTHRTHQGMGCYCLEPECIEARRLAEDGGECDYNCEKCGRRDGCHIWERVNQARQTNELIM